ncbi:hypothetical protein COU01_03490, partial [Candidatus Falkowbacteria bacterium CG10_big_fil_rev_8_21_14_0_10_44_15]
KFPFPFLNFLEGARKRKIVRENFCEVAAVALAEAGGGAFVGRTISFRATTRFARPTFWL